MLAMDSGMSVQRQIHSTSAIHHKDKVTLPPISNILLGTSSHLSETNTPVISNAIPPLRSSSLAAEAASAPAPLTNNLVLSQSSPYSGSNVFGSDGHKYYSYYKELPHPRPNLLQRGSLSLASPSAPLTQPHSDSVIHYGSTVNRNDSSKVSAVSPQATSPHSYSGSRTFSRKTRNNLPKETTYILLKWLNDHLNNPYPNSFEKNQLMVSTGLNQQQLSNWFINARRRKIKLLKEQKKLTS